MEKSGIMLYVRILQVVGVIMVISSVGKCEGGLAYDYYKHTCPDMDNIVKQQLQNMFLSDFTAPASFLRLLFHDCLVQGCDASILLDSDSANGIHSEMASSQNFGIQKRELIESVKSSLEMACPGRVSCADIMAMAAKEAVLFSGGPDIRIPLGRKDSNTCSKEEADQHIPSPLLDFHGIFKTFKSQGMNLQESVAIMGAHSLGVGHCRNIMERLDNPRSDDMIGFGFEAQMRLSCPSQLDVANLTMMPNDLTPLTFDNQYYRDVLNGRGLFLVDSSLSRDSRTAPIVSRFADDQDDFFQTFSTAFVKLSTTNVLTGGDGQVRRHCNRVN